MSKVHINARINRFIQRKIATVGDAVSHKSKAKTLSGISYEAMEIPSHRKDAR